MAVRPGARTRSRPTHQRRFHASAVLRAAVVPLSLAAALAAPFTLLGPTAPVGAQPATTVVLQGHGYGHGIGMGQWGSLGYALGDDGGAGNFTYGQILSYYYGGTTLETLGTAPAPAAFNGGNVIVAITENNGDDLIATAESGTLSVPGVTGTPVAVLFQLIGPGSTFDVYTSGGCAGQGGWQLAASGVNEPTAAATNGGPVQLCQPGAPMRCTIAHRPGQLRRPGPHRQHPPTRAVRGRRGPVGVAHELGHPGRRRPAGPALGFPAVRSPDGGDPLLRRSQPVGLRRLRRHLRQPGVPGLSRDEERDLDVAPGRQDTAGQVMVVNGTSTVATTEYSASSGGYSTPAQFPAVVDAGDAVCVSASVCNPNHSWTATLAVSSIDAAYPAIGAYSSLVVTSRNGDGAFGGGSTS